MTCFPQQQRANQLPREPIEPRLGAAMGTEQKPEPGSQQHQYQQQAQVEKDPFFGNRPQLPPRPPRSHTHTCQASGRVHPRSPSDEHDGSGSNKRPRLDETRKSSPGKFSTALSSLDNRGSGTAFDDDGNFRYAGEPGPGLLGSARLGRGCAVSGSGQDDEHHRHHHEHRMVTAERQDLLAQLGLLHTELAQMANWKKEIEDKHTRMRRGRRVAEQKLDWFVREEEAAEAKLELVSNDLRMMEEKRAQILRDLEAMGERQETAWNQPGGLEGGRGSGSGNGNGNGNDGAGR
ncbi:hypothetical protein GX51_05150 [Blastomyces parvus]|uniref:Uncharacterized protein n=1 Tax=Blastomyces parvus TaxID=2060905 RepID=A0A2B7WY24_9EURO|nr:hypothetical protein GX51_05150 [Blastomyces parvus]